MVSDPLSIAVKEKNSMKKNIGPVLGLYPMPLVVAGTMVGAKPNWILAVHLGILGHDRILVSRAKPHYTNQGTRETRALSIKWWMRRCWAKMIMWAGSAAAPRTNPESFPTAWGRWRAADQ